MTMKQLRKVTTVTVASLGILALLAAPALAAGTGDAGKGQFQLAHMGQGQSGYSAGWAGHMGHGTGHGMGQGTGHGMDHGMMMGPAHGAAPCPSSAAVIDEDIDADVVRSWLDRSLAAHGNKRLKVGDVKATDDDTIVAEIVTIDGSLVQRIEVDRQTGRMQQVN